MREPGNPEVPNNERFIAEHFATEYVEKISSAVEMGEPKSILAESKAFKLAFATIIAETTTPDEAIRKIAELIAEEASKIDIRALENMVENPHLFQALFVGRKNSEQDMAIKRRDDWVRQNSQKFIDSDDNETGALLQALALSYISKDLDEDAKKDFILTSVGENQTTGLGASFLAYTSREAIYSKGTTEEAKLDKIKISADNFLKAVWVGKKINIYQIPKRNYEIEEAFGDFYATFGNRVHSFINAIIKGEIFDYSNVENDLWREVHYEHKELIGEYARVVLNYYIKQLGLTEQEAKEKVNKKFRLQI